MKTLQYVGFSGTPCTCQYQVGEVDGKCVVVFVQGPLSQTSITNLIEVLASKVLSGDLLGKEPGEVRFFENYPPHLRPLREWQEITFADHMEVIKSGGLIAKLLDSLRGEQVPRFWAVDSPHWQPVSAALVSKLTAFIQ